MLFRFVVSHREEKPSGQQLKFQIALKIGTIMTGTKSISSSNVVRQIVCEAAQ